MSEKDPWEHRTIGLRCATCMWFVQKPTGDGRCRRHAPTMGGYPVVMPDDWCGDHRISGVLPMPPPVVIPKGK